MRIIRNRTHWPHSAHGSVMALGNFDGVHKGHQAVIGCARDLARAENKPLAVMTFEPHPRRFFRPDTPEFRVSSFADKARILREMGVDYLYVARFDAAFAAVTADAFITQILLQELEVAHVVTGHNFAFGSRRGGDVALLRQRAAHDGFDYTQVEAAGDATQDYSSTAIRAALSTGDVALAATMLGRCYSICSTVIHGDKRGRSIGFPTANLRPPALHLPRHGVYAVRMHVQGKVLDAVANWGVRPTIAGSQPLLEVHALHDALDCYGERVRVEFVAFIRPEMRFDGLDALTTQIRQDVAAALRIHETHNNREQA